MDNDIQLKLVENYFLKLRYSDDMKGKNNLDFEFLTQEAPPKDKKKEEKDKITYKI